LEARACHEVQDHGNTISEGCGQDSLDIEQNQA
jgi:hypothetical protein